MDTIQMRNFKDFILEYNKITETCFAKCVSSFMSRDITPSEGSCVRNCTEKYINSNHRIMEIFMEVQPVMVQKRIEEMNATQTLLESSEKQEQPIAHEEQTNILPR